MRVLGLGLAEHAISWSTGGATRSNDELLEALGKALAAEARLRADGALPTEAVPPRAKAKSYKQLGTPTVDAEELAEIEEVDAAQLRLAANAAREAADKELAGDSLQDQQPSEPPALDARLVGRKLEVRWRYILTPSPATSATTPTRTHDPTHTYMWCEGEVVSVADGTTDKKTERARTLLPAGALKFKWPADEEREEPESFTWSILHPQKWNRDVQNAWRWAPSELQRTTDRHPSLSYNDT
eukprot:6211298-Pleurochrysis_carterae.AAC.1